MFIIQIDHAPVPWSAHQGYGKRSYNPRWHEKQCYQWQIKSQWNQREPLRTPVKLEVVYHMAIPKSISNVRRKQMLNGIMYHTVRPDRGNLDKFLEDCLKTIVFEDDSQVVWIDSRKIYGELLKTVIKVEVLGHQAASQ